MTDPTSQGEQVSSWLRRVAESYWQDARAFDEMGEASNAMAYRAVADELRKCAKDVPA